MKENGNRAQGVAPLDAAEIIDLAGSGSDSLYSGCESGNLGAQAARQYGYWAALSADSTGKRITVQCVCGRLSVVGVEALEAGTTTSCGCRPPPLPNRAAFREEQARQKRQRDLGGWKMERGQ
jgi:hypothetical protein